LTKKSPITHSASFSTVSWKASSNYFYPNALSNARRFREEVVCLPKQHNARVAVLHVKTSKFVYPEAHSSARRFRGEVSEQSGLLA